MTTEKIIYEAAKKLAETAEKVTKEAEKTSEAVLGSSGSSSPETQAVEEIEQDLKKLEKAITVAAEWGMQSEKERDRGEIEYEFH